MRSRFLPIAALLLAPSVASATTTFPGVIQTALSAKTVPACTICHNSPTGGLGTVTTSFGVTMMKHGVVANNEASLKAALTAIGTEKTDSDGDGLIDVDELTKGTDPSVSDQGSDGGAAGYKVVYGCAASAGRSGERDDAWPGAGAALLAFAMLALVRRRRAR